MSLSSLFVSFLLGLAGLFGYHQPQVTTYGSFTPIGLNQTTLSGAGITSTANTIQLTSFLTPDGRPVTMSMVGVIGYGVLEPQTSKIEDVTFSGITQNSNGTATLTGVTRGNDFVFPYAASSSLAKAHAGGSYFIISNTAGFYGQQFLLANQISSSTAGIVYSSTTPPYYDEPGAQASGSYISTTSELASVAYVNSTVLSGAANATIAVKGIVQIATARQVASSTILGSTGAALVVAASSSTDTPQMGCAIGFASTAGAGCNIVADLTGHLKQAWIDLTAAFTFSGLLTSSGGFTATATTTLAGSNVNSNAIKINTVPYSFPSSQGNANASLVNDGSGNLSWGSPAVRIFSTTTATSTGSGGSSSSTILAFPVPANTLGTAGTIVCHMGVNYATASGAKIWVDIAYGTASTTVLYSNTSGGTVTTAGVMDISLAGAGTTGSQSVFDFITSAAGGPNLISSNVAVLNAVNSGSTAVDSTTQKQFVAVIRSDTSGSTLTVNFVNCIAYK